MGDKTFSDKTALVTGAGRGIGRAVALGLASAGADLALLARSQPELDEVAEHAKALGARAVVVPTDLADQSALAAAIAYVQKECGVIDILINNAAVVQPMGPTVDVDTAEWAAAITVNLVSPVQLTLALLPDMLRRKWGRIVNVTAKSAVAPSHLIGGNAYTTSKAALETHTLNLAAELADTGVTVNAFRPGIVDTAIHDWVRSQPAERIGEGLRNQFIKFKESGMLISPERSADALLARLGDDTTGQIRDVNDEPPQHSTALIDRLGSTARPRSAG
jgi:NAD(P)-dependent dehydrogenase (short-subunit alcohol dehydrogenase family)